MNTAATVGGIKYITDRSSVAPNMFPIAPNNVRAVLVSRHLINVQDWMSAAKNTPVVRISKIITPNPRAIQIVVIIVGIGNIAYNTPAITPAKTASNIPYNIRTLTVFLYLLQFKL